MENARGSPLPQLDSNLQKLAAFLGITHKGIDHGVVDVGLVPSIVVEETVPLDHAVLFHDRGRERCLFRAQVVEQSFLEVPSLGLVNSWVPHIPCAGCLLGGHVYDTYQLIPQFDIHLLAEQHRLRVKVRQLWQVELLGLDAQIGPLRVAPHLPAWVALVAVGRGWCFVSRGSRDDGRRILFRRVGHLFANRVHCPGWSVKKAPDEGT